MSHDKSTPKAWQLPEMGERKKLPFRVSNPAEKRKETTLEDLEQEAREKGYAVGYEEGLSAAQTETQRLFLQLKYMIDTLEHPLQLIDQQVEQALLELTLTMSEHLARHALQQAPEQILSIIKSVVRLIPMTAQKRILSLNPEDALLLEQLLSQMNEREQELLHSCRLLPDKELQRGECRLDTETVQVDATWQARIREMVEEWLYQTQTTTPARTGDSHEPS